MVLLAFACISIDRRIAARDLHLRKAHIGAVAIGARIHRGAPLPACTLPLKMNTVKVERDPRNRGVIAHMLGLVAVDLFEAGQRRAIDNKLAFDLAQPRRFERARKLCHPISVQRRIAAPLQDQIALQNAASDRP